MIEREIFVTEGMAKKIAGQILGEEKALYPAILVENGIRTKMYGNMEILFRNGYLGWMGVRLRHSLELNERVENFLRQDYPEMRTTTLLLIDGR